MVKVKSAAYGISKDVRKNLKNGGVNKKKHQKFKKIPQGKIALIDGSQVHSNGNSKNQKNGVNLQSRKKSPKGSNRQSATPKASTSGVELPSVKIDPEQETDDTDSSIEDINEGISIKEEVSAPEDEVDDDDSSEESSSEDTVNTILGKSLADETDEDDEEFDADSDVEDRVVNKGVKMFKGLKQGIKEVPAEQKPSGEDDDDDDDDDDDEEEEDDDDDDDDENNEESEEDEEDDKAAPGLAALLGESIADESDDEEFQATENDSDDDEEISDSDGEEVEGDQSVNSAIAESSNDDDEDDDDDEEDEDDSSPDITALLGKTIADDEDDVSFVGEEGSEDDEDDAMSEDEDEDEDEDDENAAAALSASPKVSKGLKNKKGDGRDAAGESREFTPMTEEEKKERTKRTIFIGNVPKESDRSALKKAFRTFGIIESMRLRGIVPERLNMPLKVAAILKKHHPMVKTVCYYITYTKEDSVNNALSMNGKKWDGNILRVDRCDQKEKPDKAKAVFLGNLPLSIEDNELRKVFKECGPINSIRIVRDRRTGVGRGIGYINFESADGAVLAMDLNGMTIRNREIRVMRTDPEALSKNRKEKRKLKRSLSGTSASSKKLRNEDSESVEVATHNSISAERRKISKGKMKRSQGEKQRTKSDSSPQVKSGEKYQGQKADAKKKTKQNKSAKKKKQMAAKLLAKPKKPAAK